MYYLALREFEPLGLQKKIVIGDEISEEALAAYDTHLHEKVFPPIQLESVKELVGDGHQKVMCKCPNGSTTARAGRPRTRSCRFRESASWT